MSGEASHMEAAHLLLGEQGWEAVCMIPSSSYLLLKRPKTPSVDSSIEVLTV